MRVMNPDGLTTGSRALVPGGEGFPGEEQSLTSIWQTLVKRRLIILCSTLLIFCW